MIYRETFYHLEEIFSHEKLKKDLLDSFDEPLPTFVRSSNSCSEEKSEFFTGQENINILSISLIRKYEMATFFPYKVEIAIGPINAISGYVFIEKFKAIMYYDSEFRIVDIDFEH